MNEYADYNFYVTEYRGTLSDELFNSYIVKASKDIERNINRKLDESIFETLDEDIKEKISYVACELCDYYNNFGDVTSDGSPNSFSIDGVSITKSNYSSQNNDISTKKRHILDDLPQDWTRYL